MIEFQWSKVDKKNNNTPIIKDTEIDELAEILLKDYKPQLLKEPRKIKYQHFLESYLGANLDFQHIYYTEDEGRILGVTAFNRENLKIFDRERMRIGNLPIDKNTIVLDHYVMDEGKEGLEIFTGLHEGGHLWMHPDVYGEPENQLSIFGNKNELKPVTCCRKTDIQNFARQSYGRTAQQWREHQADYFASAIAMPKSTFIPLAQATLKEAGITYERVVSDAGAAESRFANVEFPRIISEAYGVSKQAASIKLKKFGFIVNSKVIRQENSQLKFI